MWYDLVFFDRQLILSLRDTLAFVCRGSHDFPPQRIPPLAEASELDEPHELHDSIEHPAFLPAQSGLLAKNSSDVLA